MMQQSELDNLDRKGKDLENHLNRERNNNQELKGKLNEASNALEQAAREARNNEGRRSQEYNELQDNYSRVVSKNKAKNDEIDGLNGKIGQLEGQ